MKYPIVLFCYMLTLLSGFAQEEPLPQLQSIDGVINELLDQITIEKGEQMDTAAVRKLFHPAAIFTVADSTQAESVSLDRFRSPHHGGKVGPVGFRERVGKCLAAE